MDGQSNLLNNEYVVVGPWNLPDPADQELPGLSVNQGLYLSLQAHLVQIFLRVAVDLLAAHVEGEAGYPAQLAIVIVAGDALRLDMDDVPFSRQRTPAQIQLPTHVGRILV